MMRRYSCLLLLLGVGWSLAACSPQRVQMPPRNEEVRQAEEPSFPPGSRDETVAGQQPGRLPAEGEMLDPNYVNKRFLIYEEKFQKWQALDEQVAAAEIELPPRWPECRDEVERLYGQYERLREPGAPRERESVFEPQPLDPWDVFREDIAYLESGCNEVYATVSERVAQSRKDLSAPARKLEGVVSRYVEQHQYEEALLAYRKLERSFPGWQPSLQTKKAYGIALLRSGQIDKASQILQEVLPQLAPAEQLPLKRLVADLLWATYQFDEAKTLYQSLAYYFSSWKGDEQWVADQLAILENVDSRSKEMADYIAMLRAYLAFDGRHVPAQLEQRAARIAAKYPDSIVARRSQQILQLAKEQVHSWLKSQFALVNSLVGNKDYQQALVILKTLREGDLPAEAQRTVQETTEEVLLAQAREQEKERLRLDQDLSSRWEEASQLLDLEHYDEAREILATLMGTDYEHQARAKMKEAANSAAAKIRRQAANLFIKARKSVDPDRKMNLLLESRQLLKNIIEKYPEADIITKVTRNLEVLDKDIHELNPKLVLEPAQAGIPMGRESRAETF